MVRARASVTAAVVADLSMVGLSVYALASREFAALIAWEVGALVYLLGTGVVFRHRARRGTRDPRTGFLNTLSWVMPIAASLVGVNSAVIALLGQSFAEQANGTATAAAFGVAGIVMSWLLLHIAFVNVYMTRYSESTVRSLTFPEHRDPESGRPPREPGYAEFVYFAFTIGTTFATSDVEVRTRRMRSAVVTHSVWSFFYNALVVAVAFQVLQRFATL
ncbi:hypothetical protein nbrc107696_34830 [Gordonia spumicola]|uniref:DUF1345 domain-containing protein n=2 Tax=Gordonia spumicola TaxID=589161 RepID=A0A7I9VCK0_9ACTN|nr:hypothetical protein nbrc107696_34830 [Gordonia spumicola]